MWTLLYNWTIPSKNSVHHSFLDLFRLSQKAARKKGSVPAPVMDMTDTHIFYKKDQTRKMLSALNYAVKAGFEAFK